METKFAKIEGLKCNRVAINALLVLLLCLANSLPSLGQSKMHKYLIVHYDIYKKGSVHKQSRFFWAIEINSLPDRVLNNIYPLYLNEFSKNALLSCCHDTITAIHEMSVKSQPLESSYISMSQSFEKIILSKKRKIQEVRKRWVDGGEEIINIYATPVMGEFCKCLISESDGEKFGYSGAIILPSKSIVYYDSYWIGIKEANSMPDFYNRFALN